MRYTGFSPALGPTYVVQLSVPRWLPAGADSPHSAAAQTPNTSPLKTVQARKFAGRECTRPFSAQALYNSLDCLGNLWPRLLRTSKAPPRSLTSMSCTHARCAGLMGSQYRHTWVTVFWWRLESLYFPCEAGARRPAGDAAARRLRLSGPPCLGKISPMCPWPASVCQGSKEVTAVPTRIVVQACCFCCLRLGRVCLKTLSTQQTPNWIPMSSHSDVLQQQRTSHRKCCISITSGSGGLPRPSSAVARDFNSSTPTGSDAMAAISFAWVARSNIFPPCSVSRPDFRSPELGEGCLQ